MSSQLASRDTETLWARLTWFVYDSIPDQFLFLDLALSVRSSSLDDNWSPSESEQVSPGPLINDRTPVDWTVAMTTLRW